MSTGTDFGDAFDAGKEQARLEAATIHEYQGMPYVILPGDDGGLSLTTFPNLAERPKRREASVTLRDVPSFAAYVNRFKDDTTLLFADRHGHCVTAKLDYHEGGADGKPRWMGHTAKLQLALSSEWQTWSGKDKKAMQQAEFAEFLEQNLPDIVQPDGAVLLEAATTLELKRTVNFRKAVDLTNGLTQFLFDETEEGKGKGEVKVPKILTLGIPVYEGDDPVELRARLRYRISDDGKLSFTYVLDRPHKATEMAFSGILSQVRGDAGVPVLLGTS